MQRRHRYLRATSGLSAAVLLATGGAQMQLPGVNVTLIGVSVYIVAQLLVGAWVARRIRTEDDYLVAGRRLGYPLAIFTIFATWFGAETCIGAAGRVYESGLSGGSSDPFGYTLCLLLMGAVFAVPLWKLRLTTIADLFRQRFSGRVERFAVLLMVPTSLLWAAAQVRAFGQVIAASSHLDVTFTISVAAAVVIIYTASGGFLADAITDFIQGISLIIGLAILFGAVLLAGGDHALAAVPPERLNLFGGGELPWYEVAESWAIPVLGSAVAAEMVARVVAVRSPQVARHSFLAAGAVYLAVGLVPVALGLIGATAIPGLEHPEQVLPLLAQRHLSPLLYTLFAGALVSAILSTVDSTLLVSGSLVSHNLIVPVRPGMSEAQKVKTARICVALFGVLAYLMALQAEGVYALVEQASAFGSSGIFVVVVFGLFTRTGGELSAIATLATGVAGWVLGRYLFHLPFAFLASLAAATAVYVTVALVEQPQLERAA